MSVLRCDSCGDLIDTDVYPENYDMETDQWLCNGCWETLFENEERNNDRTEVHLPSRTNNGVREEGG